MTEALRADSTIPQKRFDEIFDRMLEAQTRAGALAGARRRRFRIAGADIELNLAPPALESVFCNALGHLEIAVSGEPGFTFHIWDDASFCVGLEPPCWVREELFGHANIGTLIDAQRYLEVLEDKSVIAAKRSSRKAAVWLRSPGDVEEWERAAPFLTLINWWASGFGYFNVHAASVGRPDGGVLIVGPSGVGKSHSAISCLDSDLFYVSDDHCLFGTSGGANTASVYSTAKLFASDLHRFPRLQQREKEAFRTKENKLVFFLNEIAPDRLSPGFSIRAILLSHPSGRRDTQIAPAPAAAALLSLGPDIVVRWPSVGRAAFARFASTLRSLPCFRLEAGTDLPQIPKMVASLLDTLPTTGT